MGARAPGLGHLRRALVLSVSGLLVTASGGPIGFAQRAEAINVPGFSGPCWAPNGRTGALEIVEERNVYEPDSQFWTATIREQDGHNVIISNMATIAPYSTLIVVKYLFIRECYIAAYNISDEHLLQCLAIDAVKQSEPLPQYVIDRIRPIYLSVGLQFPSGGAC